MKPRIYIDTSVIGGCLDPEFQKHSKLAFNAFIEGRCIMIISGLILRELRLAPERVKSILDEVPKAHSETILALDDAETLADAYIAEGAISAKMRPDAVHIAIATIARADALISWNFKHIVNLQRIRTYNAVNLKLGYPMLEIRTPREVFKDD